MKISAFTMVKDPEKRQDPWKESIRSMLDFADEVIVVDGSLNPTDTVIYKYHDRVKVYYLPWPDNWTWDEFPRHYNEGLKHCTGDWAFKFDVDYIFPADSRAELERRLKDNALKQVVTVHKISSVLSNRFYTKGELPFFINLYYRDIGFGKAVHKNTDLCQPIIITGLGADNLPYGEVPAPEMVGRSGLKFYNYDYCFKTKEFTQKEFFRFSQARGQYMNDWSWGGNENEALDKFLNMMRARLGQCNLVIPYQNQSTFIREKVRTITPDMFGYNGWGLL